MNMQDWIPIHFSQTAGWDASVQWMRLGEQRFLEPFFEQTIAGQMRHAYHQFFRRPTGVADLLAWATSNPGLPLRGIVFHMSRCGSTLLSQMLAASTQNIMLSEPTPMDAPVRARQLDPSLPKGIHVEWIRAMASALSQPRSGTEQSAFFKLDCWHIHEIETLRDAFPDTPWVFLYRDPAEVMISHARMPAAWTIPGMLAPRALGMQDADWDPARQDEYAARTLRNICESARNAAQQHNGLLMNYSELPGAFRSRLAPHFSLPEEELDTMMAAAVRDAKSPDAVFQSDTASKQAEVTDHLRALVDEHLQPVYNALEALRSAQLAKESHRILAGV